MSKFFIPTDDEIVSIEELPFEKSEMYDIGMVDTPHTFFANGILVHNSIFYEAMPIINSRKIEYTEETLPDKCIEVATEVQDYVNQCYNIYANEFHLIDKHIWKIKQELIAKRAFWGNKKKRYAMWLVREGVKVIDDLDIKGFDSVRSSFPKVFRTTLEDVIHDILHDKTSAEISMNLMEMKSKMSEYPIYSIMNPTSVNNLEKYTPENVTDAFLSKTPVHVKAAINSNRLLGVIGSPNTAPIYSGDKILWTYLTQNKYGFDVLALKGYDDDPALIQFVEDHIYRDKLFDRAMELKLESLWDSLGWGPVILNKNLQNVIDFE